MLENPYTIITGAAGFLGSHLAELLMRKGHTVIGVDNFCTGQKSNFTYLESISNVSGKFIPVVADVSKPWNWIKKDWEQKLKSIYHLASPASPPHYMRLWKETIEANTVGLKNALDFATQLNITLLFTSTSEIYGDPECSPQNESYRGNVNPVGPRACYDEAKRLGETYVWNYNNHYNTRHKIVRIFNTYGPRMNPDDGRVVINFIKQALEGKALTVYGDGKQTRSFCYVEDLVNGLVLMAESNEVGPVNLGNEFEMTILDLVKELQQIFSTKKLEVVFSSLPKDDPIRRRPAIKLAQELLGWSPKVSLRDGLNKMIHWLSYGS